MLANHKGEIPFVILLLPFLAGIGLALYLPGQLPLNIPVTLLVCLSVIFIALNISYKTLNLYKNTWLGGLLTHLLLFCAGWVCTANYNELNRDDHFSNRKAQYLVVKITNEPVIKNGLVRFAGAVTECIDNTKHTAVSGKLLISISDILAFKLNYGDVVIIPAKYNTVDPPFNPAEFNYKGYLAHQNIYHQAFFYPHQYSVVQHNTGNPVIAYSLNLRKRLVNGFNNHMRDSSAIAVASTMILGYKADLSADVLQAYANTGTLHVLSVSGAHVAIVFILLSWALSFLNSVKHGKLIKTITIIMLIWAYALLTGFSPAVNRAALMISLIIAGNNFYRYINPLNLLAASAFALLLYNPYYLTDVGFQLSYLAVGGLIVFQPILYKSIQIDNKWLDKLWSLCSVSIAAQVITFPLSVFYFHQFPVYFLLSNLFILLPVIAIMYIGLAFILLCWLPVTADALGYLLEKSIIIMNYGLTLIQKMPYASLDKLWINTLEYVLMYGVIVLLFYYLFNRSKRLLNLSLVLLLLVVVSIAWKEIDSKNNSAITFLNLKKQRAIVFKNGTDAVVLSDLKPTERNYSYSIQPGLDSAKIANVKVYGFAENINLSYLKKKGNLIQFRNTTVLLLDSSTVNALTKHPVKADYIYVTHTPPVTVEQIKRKLKYDLWVIGADNSDRYIDSLKKRLLNPGNTYYSIKRDKALSLKTE